MTNYKKEWLQRLNDEEQIGFHYQLMLQSDLSQLMRKHYEQACQLHLERLQIIRERITTLTREIAQITEKLHDLKKLC